MGMHTHCVLAFVLCSFVARVLSVCVFLYHGYCVEEEKALCIVRSQPGTSVHKVHVNCISHVTLRHLLTHLGCVYNRSL
jgi:hypothetical protein